MGNEQPTEFTEEEQKKRDKLLHKLLSTPPQPRKELKKGKAPQKRKDVENDGAK